MNWSIYSSPLSDAQNKFDVCKNAWSFKALHISDKFSFNFFLLDILFAVTTRLETQKHSECMYQ